MKSYQLYRILPNLTGDAKIDILVDGDMHTRSLMVTPVSHGDYIDTHEKDFLEGKFKRLFHQTMDTFYGTPDNYTNTKINDTFFTGTSRVPYGKYNTTHQTLISLFLGDLPNLKYGDLKINLHFKPNGITLFSKTHMVPPSVIDYLKTRSQLNPGIELDMNNREVIVHGYNPATSTLINYNSPELYDLLFTKSRSHIELCRILHDTYKNNALVFPEIINIALHYDLEEVVGSIGLSKDTPVVKYEVSTEIYLKNTLLDKYDFYTNFDYIVPYVSEKGKFSAPLPNVLDNDYLVEDILFKNQINVEYCHWSYLDNQRVLFNTSKDFISYKVNNKYFKELEKHPEIIPWNPIPQKDGSKLQPWTPQNGYGEVNKSLDKKEENITSSEWAGKIYYGSGRDVFEILNNPKPYIEAGYFNLFGETEAKKTYVGVVTTGQDVDLNNYYTSPHLGGTFFQGVVPYEIDIQHPDSEYVHRIQHYLPILHYGFYEGYDLWLLWEPGYKPVLGQEDKYNRLGYNIHIPQYLDWAKFGSLLGDIIKASKKTGNLDSKDQYYRRWYEQNTQPRTIYEVDKTGTLVPKLIKPDNNHIIEDNIFNRNRIQGSLYAIQIKNPLYTNYNYSKIQRGAWEYIYKHNTFMVIKRSSGYILPAMYPIQHIDKEEGAYIYRNQPGLNFLWSRKEKNPSIEQLKIPLGSYPYFKDFRGVWLLEPDRKIPDILIDYPEFKWFDYSEVFLAQKTREYHNLTLSQIETIKQGITSRLYDIKIFHDELSGQDRYKLIMQLR